MHFSFHQPPAALAYWVKSIWCARGTREEFARAEPIVPDGCVEIIFNLADPFSDARGLQPLDLIAGQMTGPVTAVATGDVDLIGVRFWPGRGGAALRTPMWELRDRLIAASNIVAGAGELAGVLRDLPADQRLEWLSTALARQFGARERPDTSIVDHALTLIASHRGNVAIDQLARAVGITARHLERKFRNEVGLGAKQIARIARIGHVLRLMAADAALGGAEIAAHCGYSDQAHLIRECKSLTGRTCARLETSSSSLSRLMRQDGNHQQSSATRF
jgi:AraC-like DNA-binding protein